ncbi:hypothetical protein R3P38DRAFT_2796230 [Favolaschia claudopus]|uniref:Uncharacterized protein n=1 Tax=Favolaschia claudopus TaxID=2862362 RepID=A0AAW0A6C3_9AGAR
MEVRQDPRLISTLQHRWMNEKKNVMPEISWSQLRRRFTPGFETLESTMDASYFVRSSYPGCSGRWMRVVSVSIIQQNTRTAIRFFLTVFLIICLKPQRNTVTLDPNSIPDVRNLYAPPDHEVFELVPKDFGELAAHSYAEIDSPPISRSNVWEVYNALLSRFEHLDNLDRIPADIEACWGYALTIAREDHEDDIALLPNLTPLANGPDIIREDGALGASTSAV